MMMANAMTTGLPRLMAMACVIALAGRGAKADQIEQRYTITELGPYTAETWDNLRKGHFPSVDMAVPRIDNTGNFSYRNAFPVGYRDGSPYSGAMPTDLKTSYPNSIWATGSAGPYTVGNYYNQAGQLSKFLWDGKTVQTLDTSRSYEYAVGVNDLGQVLATNGSQAQLLDFRDGSVKDIIPTYAFLPMGINHAGIVVGRGWDSERYFAYIIDSAHPQDSATWLENLIPADSGWTLGLASGINDQGQIVGVGLDPAGQLAYYRLDPIPEPSTVIIGSLLVLAALGYRRWKTRTRFGLSLR
ncbi:MAG: hypothetical protein U0800_07940 [Isosphaeraceae bacterium]